MRKLILTLVSVTFATVAMATTVELGNGWTARFDAPDTAKPYHHVHIYDSTGNQVSCINLQNLQPCDGTNGKNFGNKSKWKRLIRTQAYKNKRRLYNFSFPEYGSIQDEDVLMAGGSALNIMLEDDTVGMIYSNQSGRYLPLNIYDLTGSLVASIKVGIATQGVGLNFGCAIAYDSFNYELIYKQCKFTKKATNALKSAMFSAVLNYVSNTFSQYGLNFSGIYSNYSFELSSNSATWYSSPTAVSLISFSAVKSGAKRTKLTWSTATEINTAAFRLLRSTSSDINLSSVVNMTSSNGGPTTGAAYTVYDQVPDNGTYYYWLQEIETDSSMEIISGPIVVHF